MILVPLFDLKFLKSSRVQEFQIGGTSARFSKFVIRRDTLDANFENQRALATL